MSHPRRVAGKLLCQACTIRLPSFKPPHRQEEKPRLILPKWYKQMPQSPKGSLLRRFMEKVEITPTCWNWIGAKDDKGYGRFYFNKTGQMELAHRVVWWIENHELPTLDTCHHCDNPSCVNPDHLFQGTAKDNLQDMARKGRHWMHSRTHCRKGHELIDSNIYRWTSGGVIRKTCLTCQRERGRTNMRLYRLRLLASKQGEERKKQ